MIRVADSSDCSICKACRRLPTRYTFSHPPSMPNAMTIPRSFTPHPNPQNAAKRHHHSSPTSASTPHKVPSNTSPPPAISPPPQTPPLHNLSVKHPAQQSTPTAVQKPPSPQQTSPPPHHTNPSDHPAPSPAPQTPCPRTSGCGCSSWARRGGGSSSRRTRRWGWVGGLACVL